MTRAPQRGTSDRRPTLLSRVYADLSVLHGVWLDVLFAQRRDHHPALGEWQPSSTAGLVAFHAWSFLGAPVVAAVYPLVLVGFMVRYQARRLSRAAVSLGLLGVGGAVTLAWTLFTVGLYLTSLPHSGVAAVAAGGGVAVVAAVLATTVARRGGRASTVVVAYPLALTALFLPPVVAGFYWPPLADRVFPRSYALAVWLLDHPLSVAGVAAALREHFRLVGVAYVGMWTGLATVAGWALGTLVTAADAVRPTGDS